MKDELLSVGKLIYSRRTELELTQKEVADYVGVSEGTVSRWESGHIDNMRRDRIAALSKILKISPLSIMGIESDPTPPPLSSLKENYRIPVLGSVAAGTPIEACEDVLGYEYLSDNYKNDNYNYFALRIQGRSMEPTIMDGDNVIVRQQSTVDSGDIAIVLINGDSATAKEVIMGSDGITLVGHNVTVYSPHHYTQKDIDELPICILGKVTEIRRHLA